MRAGRSVKQTVTEFTPRKTSFPSLKLTFFAFCTKRTSTFFSDCLPVAVQVISASLLEAGAGDWAWVANGFAMMMLANAAHIRTSLFIFIGFLCCGFDLSFIGSSSVRLIGMACAIEATREREARSGSREGQLPATTAARPIRCR